MGLDEVMGRVLEAVPEAAPPFRREPDRAVISYTPWTIPLLSY